MRGTVQSYDAEAGTGSIRTKDGRIYAFGKAHLLRRSKSPRKGVTIVFRLKNGKVARAIVPSDKGEPSKWETAIAVLDIVVSVFMV